MIWLASFPRSGNTFFRIILHEVYGVESSTFHKEPGYAVDADYDNYPVVKTHLLPRELVPADPKIPAVYIVRDGRDALVSMAHHRKDIVAPGSDYRENLKAAIAAGNGSFFGGWSQNVSAWLKRAAVVIRFEDLVRDPVACAERIRPLIPLPEPRLDKVPSFEDLKTKEMRYGSGSRDKFSEEERKARREKFFRRGEAGSWKEEMPEDLHALFWKLHGGAMGRLGYLREESLGGRFRGAMGWRWALAKDSWRKVKRKVLCAK